MELKGQDLRVAFWIPTIAAAALIVSAVSILPENCHFFGEPNLGLMCDGFTVGVPPPPCPECKETVTAMTAKGAFWIGIFLLAVPGVIYFISNRPSDETPTHIE